MSVPARPLHVVQLLPALESGGVERSTLEIAAALRAAGHRATVVSAGGVLVPQLEAMGAVHETLPIGRKALSSLGLVRPLRRRLAALAPDIVHLRSRLPAWLGWLAWRRLPPPRPRLVTTVHGLNSPGRYSAVMLRGERIICVSHTVRAHLLRHYPGLDPGRLQVIARGIDPGRFRPGPPDPAWRAALDAELPQLAGRRLLLLPGRGTRLKGHDAALVLLAGLVAGNHDVALWMPGVVQPGRERYLAELRTIARGLGVPDRLALTPARSDMPAVYAAADLVLQLSARPEALGRTVLEALACGRPVLGFDHGGVGESLASLFPQGRVPPGDHVALLGKARTLLEAPPRLPAYAGPTLAAMQRATLELYAELVDGDG
jgi:glycosyltransferase involved in cell wall biosynthesis